MKPITKKGYTFDDVQLIPKYSEIESRSTIDVSTQLTKGIRIQKPIVAAPMDTVVNNEVAWILMNWGGMAFYHRFDDKKTRMDSLDQYNPYIHSIGLNDKDVLEKISQTDIPAILIDVAYGNNKRVIDLIQFIKKEYPKLEVIAGNIATGEGARRLCDVGVDAIRCGIGGGHACTTRVNTGIGIPQLTSIMEVSDIANQYDVPVIADGGIRTSGDIAKAIAAGASTVMIGKIIASHEEAPGDTIIHNGTKYKEYRGMASQQTKEKYGQNVKNIEGEYFTIKQSDVPLETTLDRLVDGLQSAMSYTGATNIDEFHMKAEFIEITPAGAIEASTHGKNS